MNREACRSLDAADPLALLRERFCLPHDTVYLDGNSLGALPAGVTERVTSAMVDQWGADLIRSWNVHGWLDLPTRLGARIGRLVGAPPGTVIVGDSTTVNLYKLVRAATDGAAGRSILTDTGNFPTDLYVLASVAEGHRLGYRHVEPDDVVSAIDESVALVAVTEVDYRTGRRHDISTLTTRAHEVGARVLCDLSHSAGVVPVDLAAWNVDFAVGCGYKYLNGGPGAPSFAYVASSLLEDLRNPITGWFAHADPFAFEPTFRPTTGVERLRVGTLPILSMLALDAALDVFDGVDMTALWEKSMSLTSLFIDLVDRRIGSDVEIVTPRDPAARGSHVSLRHPNGFPIVQALIDRGVVGDFRAPDIMRFGFAPLYGRHVDVWDAVDALASVLESEAWRHPRYAVRHGAT